MKSRYQRMVDATSAETGGINGFVWVVFRKGKVYKIESMGDGFPQPWHIKWEKRIKAKERLRRYGRVYSLFASNGRVSIPWKHMTKEQKQEYEDARGVRKK